MSFESKYRSEQGATEISKVYNFIAKLIIKNNYEANAEATSESTSEYFKYFGAYSKTDSFSDYLTSDRRTYEKSIYTYMSSLKERPYTTTMGLIKTLSESRATSLQKGYDDGLEMYKDYLTALRIARIFHYEEKNNYYRQFMGLPNKKSDYVYVTDFDISEDGFTEVTDFTKDPDPKMVYYTRFNNEIHKVGYIESWYDPDTNEKIVDNFWILNLVPIHEVTEKEFPLTYSYYILQNNIQEIINKKPDLNYLRFIGKGYTAYYLHELPNYAIIQYDPGILDANELELFFKSYNKARQQVIMDYIEGFDKRQPLYNILMIQNLLYYTVLNYSNSYIEKYSIGIYSVKNLDDILNSNGYSNLTKISSKEIKYRIVKNLNDLIENKGNNYILELILDRIIKDKNSDLKRYYLEKQYNTNEIGEISIDTSRGLEHSIDLTFREISATSVASDEIDRTSDEYKDYAILTKEDDLWAGIQSDDTEETKAKKKSMLKKELLALNFNSILTRYITLISTVDILEVQTQTRDMLYLMFKYIDMTEDKGFFRDTISVGPNVSGTPAAVFAAMCWLQQMKTFKNPDIIEKNNIVINNSSVFRHFGKLAVDRQSFENTVIYDGTPITSYDISTDIANWKVAEFIKENPETFADFFTEDGVETERIETVRVKDAILKPEWKNLAAPDGELWKKERPYIPADGYKHLVDEEESIDDSIVVYRFYSGGIPLGEITSETTFSDLIEDYKHQMPNMIARLTNKLSVSCDFNTYQAWLFLQNQIRKDNSILFIFKDYDHFSTYITEYCDCGGLVEWLENELRMPIVSSYHKPKMEYICEALEMLTTSFKEWVNDHFSKEIYANDELTGNSSYIEDMRILFNEFLSVYSELYSVDFRYTLGDKETMDYCINLYYNPLQMHLTQSFNDHLELLEELWSKLVQNLNDDESDDDFIKLLYDYFSRAKVEFEDAINKELVYDKKTNEYIPEDPYDYEFFTHMADTLFGWLGLEDGFENIKVVASIPDEVELSGILKIKSPDEGEKVIYE